MIPHVSSPRVTESACPSRRPLRLERHLRGHPQPHAPADQAKPHHEVVLLGAVEPLHGLAEEARVDEEGRDPCNRVMLRRTRWFVLV